MLLATCMTLGATCPAEVPLLMVCIAYCVQPRETVRWWSTGTLCVAVVCCALQEACCAWASLRCLLGVCCSFWQGLDSLHCCLSSERMQTACVDACAIVTKTAHRHSPHLAAHAVKGGWWHALLAGGHPF